MAMVKVSRQQMQVLLVVKQRSQQVLSAVKLALVANAGSSRTNQGQQQVLAMILY
jgi:hypothetical protein